MLPEFQDLYERNPDIVGWLKIDDTRIDYPVMQNLQDGEYYLNHDFDKKETKTAFPFWTSTVGSTIRTFCCFTAIT